MLLSRCLSESSVPLVEDLAAHVPFGFCLSPGDGDPEVGLAALWVPREGVPGRGPEEGADVAGGADVDLRVVEEPWGAASRGRGARPPR